MPKLGNKECPYCLELSILLKEPSLGWQHWHFTTLDDKDLSQEVSENSNIDGLTSAHIGTLYNSFYSAEVSLVVLVK